MPPHRLIVVPRRGGRPRDERCPWFPSELAGSQTFGQVLVGNMPDPEEPVVEACTAHLADLAGDDPKVLQKTILFGPSVGCRAGLNFFSSLPQHTRPLVALGVWQPAHRERNHNATIGN